MSVLIGTYTVRLEMGFKRPLDDNKFHELPFKHSRQLGFNDKSMQFEESSQSTLATVDEGDLLKPQGGETFDEESSFAYLGLDVEGCIDPVMEDCHREDATHSPRTFAPVETFYSFLLDQPARKQVPIGPDHQAMIHEWEGSLNGNLEPLGTGTCVIPMPAHMDDNIHVKESREDMVKVLGSEKFRDMGFCDMGEEVAQRWCDEDALLFHEIVYSYPVTLGQNFWKHLEAVFLSRTKHEIVSYYFNVFVPRRRAVQNRSLILDIDSDDDEWHGGSGGGPLGAQYVEEDGEEEDFAVDSPLHQETEKFNEKVHPLHQDEVGSISDNDEDDTREGGSGLCDEHKMNAGYMDMFSGCNEERLNVEDDSCLTL
ncbi:hypothetical protein HID58_055898 [Brassica napus]|uniref:ELM2 domain-containing protein n=1 Tax=Brassica napus TaxID=3708 RepID=A0ABQ8ALP8_BRANA|nr:hypothetical protein HID58_055898 [Brassica napus]